MKRDRTSAPAACLFLMPFSSEARQNMTELFHKQPAGTGNTTYWQSGSVCMSLRLFPGHCEQITFIHSDRSWSNLRTQSSLYFWFKQILHTSPLISPHESFEAHSWQCTLNINLCFLWIIIVSFFLDTSIMVPLSKSQPWHFYAKHKPRWSLDNLWNHFIARHPLQLMSPWCCVSFILYNILNEQLCGGSSYGLGIDKSLRRVNGHLFISMIASPNSFSATHNIPLLHLP